MSRKLTKIFHLAFTDPGFSPVTKVSKPQFSNALTFPEKNPVLKIFFPKNWKG